MCSQKGLSGGPLFSARGGSGPQQARGGSQEAIRGLWQDASQIQLGRAGAGSGLSTAGCQSEQERAGVRLPETSEWSMSVRVSGSFVWKQLECIDVCCIFTMFYQYHKGHVLAVLLWESCRPGPLVNVVQSSVTNGESSWLLPNLWSHLPAVHELWLTSLEAATHSLFHVTPALSSSYAAASFWNSDTCSFVARCLQNSFPCITRCLTVSLVLSFFSDFCL